MISHLRIVLFQVLITLLNIHRIYRTILLLKFRYAITSHKNPQQLFLLIFSNSAFFYKQGITKYYIQLFYL